MPLLQPPPAHRSERPARRAGKRPWDWALVAVETVLALPVLLVWWLLYRWGPDPP